MEWIPEISMGWLNGWIPLGALTLVDMVLFLLFPREVVARLFDRSGWPRRQVVFTVIGKLSALVGLALLVCTPLKIGSPIFYGGLIVSGLGVAGSVIALFNFKNTPITEPVTRGIYQVSRHPQNVMATVVLLGGCIAIGSWSALLSIFVARVFSHFGILAEESVCLEQYGDDYRSYLKRVPRYFLFF